MGQVWRGAHRRTGLPVAVKVVREELARVPAHVATFRNEVRAMTRLDHPCILAVLDYGEVTRQAAATSQGALLEGSPYFVMEYAGGGSLKDLRRRLTWPDTRRVLLSLLDALAHAHARGVVHRDLKAGNVLVATDDDARPGLKLADFGIAHAFADFHHRDDRNETAAGTLQYMAREQLAGAWREYGPWTDLFALACLAWRLMTGSPPFYGVPRDDILAAHKAGPADSLPASARAPTGLEAWLRRLLNPDPRHRFTRAADAAWALLGLGEPESADVGDVPVVPPVSFDTREIDEPDTVLGTLGRELPDEPTETFEGIGTGVPPIPLDWRRTRSAPLPLTLQGAGLELFPLREMPLVGREAERDRLWSLLVTASQARQGRFVVLTGPPGSGKSHLSLWLAARAHELGAALALRHHGGSLSELLRRHLRVAGLFGAPLKHQLRRTLRGSSREVRSLALALLQDQIRDRVERFSAVHTLLEELVERSAGTGRTGPGRSLVLILEDDLLGEATAFARWLLDRQHHAPLPVLVVLMASMPSPPEKGPLALLVRGGAEPLHLGPLLPAERTELVQGMLRLERGLAARVDEASAGNPQLAVGMVEDMVQRGALAHTADGFALRPGVELRLPDALHDLWTARMEAVLDGLDPEAAVDLERAAVLGREVDESLWHTVCEDPASAGGGRVQLRPEGLLRRAEVAERLLREHLAVETDAGFRFADEAIRVSLLRRAEQGGRLRSHHAACVEALAQLRAPDPARIGRHLRGAGHLDRAFSQLMAAAWGRLDRTEWRPAMGLLSEGRTVLDEVGAVQTDPRWPELFVALADGARGAGHLDDARRYARRAVRLARDNAPDQLVEALFQAAQCAAALGRHDEVLPLLDELEPLAERASDREHGRCLFARGTFLQQQGEDRAGRALLDRARRLFVRCDDPLGQANVDRVLGGAALAAGDLSRAEELLAAAASAYEALGMRATLSVTWAALADVYRKAHRLDEADELLARLMTLQRQVGTGVGAVLVHLNLGLVRLERSDWQGARRAFDRAIRLGELTRYEGFVGAAWGSLLLPLAHLEDWPAFDTAAARAAELLTQTGFTDADLLSVLDATREVVDPDRRERVEVLIAQQRAVLG